jgi:hypothetical protein
MRPFYRNIRPEKNFFDHAALSLHFVLFGAHNKGYTVRGSARPSPKFFFRYAPEKLRISLTLYEMPYVKGNTYYEQNNKKTNGENVR